MGGAANRKMGGQTQESGGLKVPNIKVGGFGLRSMKWLDERHGRIIYELNFLFVFNDKCSFIQSDNPIQNNLQVNASVFV